MYLSLFKLFEIVKYKCKENEKFKYCIDLNVNIQIHNN